MPEQATAPITTAVGALQEIETGMLPVRENPLTLKIDTPLPPVLTEPEVTFWFGWGERGTKSRTAPRTSSITPTTAMPNLIRRPQAAERVQLNRPM